MLIQPKHHRDVLIGAVTFWLAVLFAGVGCNDAPAVPIDEIVDAVSVETMASAGSNQVDVLFMIDNLPELDEQQQMLGQAFPRFIQGLADLGADFHIGVITPSIDKHAGALQADPGSVFKILPGMTGNTVVIEDGTFELVSQGHEIDDFTPDDLQGNADQVKICDADDKRCVMCNADGSSCTIVSPRDPRRTVTDVLEDAKSARDTYNVTCTIGAVGGDAPMSTVQCSHPLSVCNEIAPGNLSGCYARFAPLMDDGEQVTCTVNAEACNYSSGSYPSYQRECEDWSNATCNAVDGPAGIRRCKPTGSGDSGVCEIKTPFLRSSDYLNADGSMDNDALIVNSGCFTNVGTCSLASAGSRGFDAIRSALDPDLNKEGTKNYGFIRDNALLLLVVVSATDDCSTGIKSDGTAEKGRQGPRECWFGDAADSLVSVNEMYEFLTTKVKRSPSQVLATGILGPVPPNYTWDGLRYTCTRQDESGNGVRAQASVRYSQFIRKFGAQGIVSSMCEADFSPVLGRVTRVVSRSLGQTCLDRSPKICTVGGNDCSPGSTCVQAAPPRDLMRDDVEVELGRDDADLPIKDDILCDGSDDPADAAKYCATSCSSVTDCLVGNATDERRNCANSQCVIGGATIACSTDSDCLPEGVEDDQKEFYVCDETESGKRCFQGDLPPGTSPRYICDDFKVVIESAKKNTNEWVKLNDPGKPQTLDYNDDRDYEVNYYANEVCGTTGMAFRFVNAPGADDDVRISYPISLRDEIFQ